MRRPQGTGSIFQRGKTWFVQYYWRGERRRENSHSEDRADAERLLHKRLGEIATGTLSELAAENITVGRLLELLIEDYNFRRMRNAKILEWSTRAHTLPMLGSIPAAKFRASDVRRYVAARRQEGAKDSTINRELSAVRRGFTLGSHQDPPLVNRIPYIPKLEEDNVRQGFLEPDQYEKLLTQLPQRLKALYVCAYHAGTRKGELRKIRWDQVDFEAGLIRLTRGQTKGKVARTLPIYGDMERWLRLQWDGHAPDCPWVFYYHGRPVGAQLRGWREACEAAGMPDLLFHDLRRSAVRNMKRAGVQDKVAMTISGHKTRAIFERYNIVDEGDLGDAGEKLAAYFTKRKKERAAKLKLVK